MHDIHVVGIIELDAQATTCLAGHGQPARSVTRASVSLPASSEWLDADVDALMAELHVVARRVMARVAVLRRPHIARNR